MRGDWQDGRWGSAACHPKARDVGRCRRDIDRLRHGRDHRARLRLPPACSLAIGGSAVCFGARGRWYWHLYPPRRCPCHRQHAKLRQCQKRRRGGHRRPRLHPHAPAGSGGTRADGEGAHAAMTAELLRLAVARQHVVRTGWPRPAGHGGVRVRCRRCAWTWLSSGSLPGLAGLAEEPGRRRRRS